MIYLLLGRFIEKNFTGEERYTTELFYLTGLVFVVLIIPLQFGVLWLSLGWLVEGVALATYGILINEKRIKLIGYTISALCLFAFLVYDTVTTDNFLFVFKYFAITVGSLIILGAHMRLKMMSGQFVKIYKYFMLANVWIFLLYLIAKLEEALYVVYGRETVFQIDYLFGALGISVTLLLAYAYPRIKLLSDQGTQIMSIALHIIGILTLLGINSSMKPVSHEYIQMETNTLGYSIVGAVILILLGVLSAFAVRDLMKSVVQQRKLSIEWLPLVVSGYLVIILTQNLIVQFGLQFHSVAISIIYILTALAWIAYGFVRRYSFIRKFGLGLAILAVVKFFLIDISGLTQGYIIVSYFTLGMTLIGISFIYQYFSKRLKVQEELTDDVENSP